MGFQEAFEFEELVGQLLAANGFETGATQVGPDRGVDLIAEMRGQRWAIEIKYYRTARGQVQLIRAAAGTLLAALRIAQARRGMLVVSSYLTPELKSTLENEFGISIAGRDDLIAWTAKAPHLADRLASLLELDAQTLERVSARSLDSIVERVDEPSTDVALETTGVDLCTELRALQRGRSHWAPYERLAERILRYLFPNDLHGWHQQRRTDDGLNRFDLVCRVKSISEFWQFLIQHVGTRYVLFEFKNYARPIKQGQILTTEKYLLEKGLRRTAVLFTRAGAGADAISMAKGAMREQGKLMIVLDDDQVCTMLHMRDRGEDPSDLLFSVADDFLLALPR